jgi:hypothetical protein
MTALRDRFAAPKPEAHAPQSGWHGFVTTIADIAGLLDLFEVGSVESARSEASVAES